MAEEIKQSDSFPPEAAFGMEVAKDVDVGRERDKQKEIDRQVQQLMEVAQFENDRVQYQTDKILEAQKKNVGRDMMAALNRGILEMLDQPGDATAGIMNLIPWEKMGLSELPSGGFQGLGEELGILYPKDDEPDDIAFNTMKMVGGQFALLPAVGSGAVLKESQLQNLPNLGPVRKALIEKFPKLSTALEPIGQQAASNIARQTGEAFRESPIAFTASDVAVTTAGGIGSELAKKLFPNEPVAEVYGLLLGVGVASGALSPTVFAVNQLRRGGSALKFFFSEAGQNKQAVEILSRNVTDAQKSLKNLEAKDTIEGLTAGQETGDSLLLALEKRLLESGEKTALEREKQLTDINEVIYEKMMAPPEAEAITKETLEETRAYLKTIMDEALKRTVSRAKDRLMRLEPNASREEANLVAKEEIMSVAKIADATEQQLWGIVPNKKIRHTTATISSWRRFLEDMSKIKTAQTKGRSVIPKGGDDDLSDLWQWLGSLDKNGNFVPGEFEKAGTDLKNLQELRSRILTALRNEQGKSITGKAPIGRRVAILSELQGAILDDLGAQSFGTTNRTSGGKLRTALNFSRDKAQRFDRGTVGRILGTDLRGAPLIKDSLTLNSALVGTGPKAKENLNEIMSIFDSIPKEVRVLLGRRDIEVPKLEENQEALLGAVENFVKHQLVRRFVKGDSINVAAAERFLNDKDNLEFMQRFPHIVDDVKEAIRTGNAVSLKTSRFNDIGKRYNNPKLSVAALYMQREPFKAFDLISKETAPSKKILELVRQVKVDKSGEALEGLQQSFLHWILNRSVTNRIDGFDRPFVSGFKMDQMVKSEKIEQMAKELLSVEQFDRLKKVIATTKKMELSQSVKVVKARPGVEEEFSRESFLDDISGVVGSKVGRQVGKGTLIQQHIFAKRFRKLGRFIMKKRGVQAAEEILVEALSSKNPDLLKSLLESAVDDAGGKKAERAYGLLRGWYIMALRRAGEDIELPEDEFGDEFGEEE